MSAVTASASARGDQVGLPGARALAAVVGLAFVLRLLLSQDDADQAWSDIIAVAVFTAVALVIGLGIVVPRALRTPPPAAATAALALGVTALVVLVLFFYSGAPFMLGYAAWFLSRTSTARAASGRRAGVGGALGLAVMALNVAVAVGSVATAWAPGLPG